MTFRTAFASATLVLALAVPSARADNGAPREPPQAVTLDMDKDGKMDLATLTVSGDGSVELRIFMAVSSVVPDASRKPDIIKNDIAGASFNWLESNGDGSLVVKYGCGGCSDDTVTALTIIHRGGEFLMSRYALDWDTRNGIGSCEVDFFMGKGVMTQGLDGEVTKRFKKKFGPLKLADWSDEMQPEECKF